MADDGLLNYKQVSSIPGEHISNFAFNVSDELEYFAYAAKGTADDEAKWVIHKITYSGSLIETIRVAKNVAWDNRASVSYE
jgi:hypothetical protein